MISLERAPERSARAERQLGKSFPAMPFSVQFGFGITGSSSVMWKVRVCPSNMVMLLMSPRRPLYTEMPCRFPWLATPSQKTAFCVGNATSAREWDCIVDGYVYLLMSAVLLYRQ